MTLPSKHMDKAVTDLNNFANTPLVRKWLNTVYSIFLTVADLNKTVPELPKVLYETWIWIRFNISKIHLNSGNTRQTFFRPPPPPHIA